MSPDVDSSGAFDADNVFVKVVPFDQDVPCCDDEKFRKGKTDSRFDLPANHLSGTYLYHAHKHGSTFPQIRNGLACPLIINDPPVVMPPYIENVPQKIILFTSKGPFVIDQFTGNHSGPVTDLASGAFEQWRKINADPRTNSFLKVSSTSDDIELYQIAFATAFDPEILPDLDDGEVALDASERVVEIQVAGAPIEADWSDEIEHDRRVEDEEHDDRTSPVPYPR